ncbi:hypothetical protein [Streptomyces caelestis]|uniref:Uncharacterized protein n=1 Tax=Streptomyces caelestis TaxID=36816 RepID=A0A7W9LVI9_9ACTN|nr:hypothetical protein [Streptomyces caelestis]MBB5797726.1 hypothetical protein [Streptomyces caelestis]GGW68272.1 hypothetical protein GCM10010320_56960 [Streptomyces caelestis]
MEGPARRTPERLHALTSWTGAGRCRAPVGRSVPDARTRIRAAYDKAWLVARNDARAKTLALIGREISGGSNAEVVAAARAARPVVRCTRTW